MNFGIDFLRHLFSIAVILQHMTSASRYSVETNLKLTSVVDWIDSAVFGFFFISGYLFKDPDDLFTYIKKQLIRFLVPFFLFSTIYALILSVLGKTTLQISLVQTITLHGIGAQLYFLPYLLFVTISYAWFAKKITPSLRRQIEYVLVISFILISLQLPTISSTGSDLKLIPYYCVAFLAGVIHRTTFDVSCRTRGILSGSFVSILLGFIDPRFFDVAGILLLFTVVHKISRFLPNHRLHGSGGIYLLHTPVINFGVSTLLTYLNINQGLNIFISVILTYLICLFLTIAFVRLKPKYRWLLLE